MLLLVLEIAYGYFVKNQKHRVMDSVSSISSGLTNILKDSLGIGLIIVTYPYLVEHLALMEIRVTWAVWSIAFIVIDFAGYWNHRLSHKVNFFWNQHVIRHSSEEFNLACALRQSISNLNWLFSFIADSCGYIGRAPQGNRSFGANTFVRSILVPYPHIGKMGWLEYIIITPSQQSGAPCDQCRIYR